MHAHTAKSRKQGKEEAYQVAQFLEISISGGQPIGSVRQCKGKEPQVTTVSQSPEKETELFELDDGPLKDRHCGRIKEIQILYRSLRMEFR